MENRLCSWASTVAQSEANPECGPSESVSSERATVRFAPVNSSCRYAPRCRHPVPASIMTTPSLDRTSRQVVLPPQPRWLDAGVGMVPRTPQNFNRKA